MQPFGLRSIFLNTLTSGSNQFDKKTVERGRVDEGYLGSLRTFARSSTGQTEPCSPGARDRGPEVGHSKRHVMYAFAPVAEKAGQRPVGRQGSDELDVGPSDRNKGHGDLLRRHRGSPAGRKPECRDRHRRLHVQIADDDCQVRKTRNADHTTAEGR